MNKYKITTTDGLSFDIHSEELKSYDIVENKDGTFHLIHDGKSYTVEVLEADYLNKSYVLNINEKEIALDLKDELDQAIEKMGFSQKATFSGGSIESPMPGMVLEVDVKVGDKVQQGDVLLILEAMKMENIIKSTIDGKVEAVHVSEGDTVAKRQLLIELSE